MTDDRESMERAFTHASEEVGEVSSMRCISKRRTLLSSATAADEGGSHPSHRLVMIGYGQRASARFCAITYDGYRPVIRGLVVVRDHSLSKPFHNAVSVLTKKSVRSHAQGFFSVGGWTNTLTTT